MNVSELQPKCPLCGKEMKLLWGSDCDAKWKCYHCNDYRVETKKEHGLDVRIYISFGAGYGSTA